MKGDRVKDVTMEITVGAFIFMILLGLGIFTIIVSQRNLFKQTYEYTVEFPDVAGLREGESVYSRGLHVGKVGATEFLEDREGVLVLLRLDKPVKLHEDYEVQITESSLLGGRRVNIIEGSLDRPLVPESQFQSLHGSPPGDVMQEALATVRSIREAIESSGIIENVSRFTEDLTLMSAAVNSQSGSVGRLIYQEDLYENVNRAVASMRVIAANLEAGEGTIGALLDPEQNLIGEVRTTVSNLNAAISNIRGLTDRVAAGEGLAGALFDDNAPLYTNLVAASDSIRAIAQNFENSEGTLAKLINDPTLYNNLMETSESLKEIAAQVQEGEGSLAQFINNPDLYDSTRSLMTEARAAIDDLRETSPITTFSSIFFGAF